MWPRYAIRKFTDGAIPVYLAVDPESGMPYYSGGGVVQQSISPTVLRLIMRSVMPEGVEVETPPAQEGAVPIT